MKTIITGAAGRIGSEIVEALCKTHELCLIDRRAVPGHVSIVADLGQYHSGSRWRARFAFRPPRWTDAFKGADVVLHLAAEPNPRAPWQNVLRNNIQATWNVLEAAVRHRVRRVVFASSNWAVKARERALAPACYRAEGPRIGSGVFPCPQTPYGVSKAFGELVGRSLIDEGRLETFVVVRLGFYCPQAPKTEESQRLWIGPHDLRRLLQRCVETERPGFHVVYGVSAQATAPYDLSYTRRFLSWEPWQKP